MAAPENPANESATTADWKKSSPRTQTPWLLLFSTGSLFWFSQQFFRLHKWCWNSYYVAKISWVLSTTGGTTDNLSNHPEQCLWSTKGQKRLLPCIQILWKVSPDWTAPQLNLYLDCIHCFCMCTFNDFQLADYSLRHQLSYTMVMQSNN